MGAGGEDVQMSTAARRQMPYSIECKNTERLNIWSAIEQCKANAPADATPLVVFKRNRSETYAVVPWAHLVRLRKRLRRADADADAPPRDTSHAAASASVDSPTAPCAVDIREAQAASVRAAVEPHVRAMVEQICACLRARPARTS